MFFLVKYTTNKKILIRYKMGNDVYHFCNCDKNEITMTKDINEKVK